MIKTLASSFCITRCYMFPVTEDDDSKRREGKKERVLHTRVPAVLEQELKRVASAWRVPVSNVVRALLADALDTIDVVGQKAEGELRGVAELLAAERNRLRAQVDGRAADLTPAPRAQAADPLAGAVGATPITLVHDTVCELTGAPLRAGSRAHLVLFEAPGRRIVVAENALPQVLTSTKETTP